MVASSSSTGVPIPSPTSISDLSSPRPFHGQEALFVSPTKANLGERNIAATGQRALAPFSLWSPVQRLHQFNELLAQHQDYQNFEFWVKLVNEFFSLDPRSCLRLIFIDGNCTGGNERPSLPIQYTIKKCLIARFFHVWAGSSENSVGILCRLFFMFGSIVESSVGGYLCLESKSTRVHSLLVQGNLCVEQYGQSRFIFNQIAKFLYMELSIFGNQEYFVKNYLSPLPSPALSQLCSGFPPEVIQYLNICTSIDDIFPDTISSRQSGELFNRLWQSVIAQGAKFSSNRQARFFEYSWQSTNVGTGVAGFSSYPFSHQNQPAGAPKVAEEKYSAKKRPLSARRHKEGRADEQGCSASAEANFSKDKKLATQESV